MRKFVMCSTNGVKRGAMIVLEGMDRSGKTTQCKKLVESLEKRNIPAKFMNYPDRTTFIGGVIDEYLKNKNCELNNQTIHLLFSANRWENVEKMERLLKEGVTLIIDRYAYSGIAYSSSKESMDIEWCKQPEIGLPKPDLVFLLTLSEEEMLKRAGFGLERYENPEMQKKVSKVFLSLCDEEDNWSKIDASGTVDEVHENLLNQVLKEVEKSTLKPLDYLTFKHTT